jgi:hypothetical protein
MRTSNLTTDERAVSVVVGALMLIIIVVTAATGIAVMVAQMQKEEVERQSHLAAVEHEALEIRHLDLELTENSSLWNSINLTIVNLNVKDSYLTAVSVNDRYATHGTAEEERVNLTRRILVPAMRSVELELNLTTDFENTVNLSMTEPVAIRIVTSLLNHFERTFQPPAAIVKTRIEPEDLGVADRDVLVLDGSESFDDGTIISWSWTVVDGSATTPPGNWSDWANTTSRIYSGKLVRAILNSSGPFRAHLTVTDDTEMVGVSDYLVLPANPNFNPPTKLNAEYTYPTITATVRDIEGKPVEGCAVSFLVVHDVYGNLTLDRWSTVTNGMGIATTNVTAGNGTVRVLSGKLPYVELPF